MRRAGFGTLAIMSAAVAMTVAVEADLRLVDAARNRDHRAVEALLTQNGDVNTRGHDGSTALLWAAHWNDLDTADLLIRAGANVNAANDLRMTPLSLACTNGKCAARRRALEGRRQSNTRDRHW